MKKTISCLLILFMISLFACKKETPTQGVYSELPYKTSFSGRKLLSQIDSFYTNARITYGWGWNDTSIITYGQSFFYEYDNFNRIISIYKIEDGMKYNYITYNFIGDSLIIRDTSQEFTKYCKLNCNGFISDVVQKYSWYGGPNSIYTYIYDTFGYNTAVVYGSNGTGWGKEYKYFAGNKIMAYEVHYQNGKRVSIDSRETDAYDYYPSLPNNYGRFMEWLNRDGMANSCMINNMVCEKYSNNDDPTHYSYFYEMDALGYPTKKIEVFNYRDYYHKYTTSFTWE